MLKFPYEDEVYTPMGAKVLTDRELRAEYSRLRSIARKRLERFGGSEYTDTQIYKYNVGKYKPVRELNNTEMRHLLSDAYRFLNTETGSVSGMRRAEKKSIALLKEHGYDFVNRGNYRKFVAFFEYARHQLGRLKIPSDDVALFFREHKELDARKIEEAFDRWLEDGMPGEVIGNKKPVGSGLVRKKLRI